jgi:NIPSNAP
MSAIGCPRTIYIIKHKSREAAKASWDAFRTDPEWKKAQGESEKDGKIVERVEAVYMDAVPYSPMK